MMILFDLDGTLADTAPDLALALNRLRQQNGLKPLELETVRPYASYGTRGLLKIGFDMTEDHSQFELYRKNLLDYYDQVMLSQSQLFPGIAEVLARLQALDMSWGIVTNKPRYFSEKLLQHLEWLESCPVLVAGDDVAQAKPHPEALLLACQQLKGEPEHCLYVGDAKRDIEAAQAAGMQSMLAVYGYVDADEDYYSWQADFYISKPEEILAWLNK